MKESENFVKKERAAVDLEGEMGYNGIVSAGEV